MASVSGLVPIVWAFKVAPVVDGIEKLVLEAIADAADEDGCNSYQSQATIAERAMIDVRTVRRRIADLEERGLIARGDQRAAEHLPADKRPVVWDVMIPYTAFGDGIDSVNSYRKGKGRGPITTENRPALPPAPMPKRRADKGKKRADSETGGTSSPTAPSPENTGGLQVRPVTESPGGGTSSPERGDFKSDNLPQDLPLVPSPEKHPPSSLRSDGPPEGDQLALIDAEPTEPVLQFKTKRRIPDDFAVTERMRQWFIDQGLGTKGVDGRLETEQFIDHHRSRGTTMLNWELAWHTWMRNAVKFNRSGSGRPTSNVHQLPVDDPTRQRHNSYFSTGS